MRYVHTPSPHPTVYCPYPSLSDFTTPHPLPQPVNFYLRYIHERETLHTNIGKVHTMVYNMEDFLKSSVRLYQELVPQAPCVTRELYRKVSTLCVFETHQKAVAAVPMQEGAGCEPDIGSDDAENVGIQGGREPSGGEGVLEEPDNEFIVA